MRDARTRRKGVARRALVSVAIGVASAVIAATTVSAQILGGSGGHDVNLPGGGGVDLPDQNGGGGVTLPGGTSVQLPGGSSGGGHDVNLPGGGGVDLGGGGGDQPAPAPTPAPTPTTPTTPTPTPAPSDGSTEPTTEAPATTGGGGGGGRGTGESAGHRHHGGRTDQDTGEGPIGTGPGQVAPPTLRDPSGAPAPTNPGLTVADFGPAPIGVPNLVIDQFSIPPFLLPIYQACGTQYGIPWQVLASINRIETAFGTNLNVSTAGALGWMQFMPATWKTYGVDANNDGRKDPYNPVDAICAAARYLKAAGGDNDLRHGDLRLQPRRLVRRRGPALREPVRQACPRLWSSSLTGLTEGARFPVAADVPLRGRHRRARGRSKRAENGHRRRPPTPPT